MQLDTQPQPIGVFDTKAPIMKLTTNDIYHIQEEGVIR